MLWPSIFKNDIIINFAYPSFKWKNNAKDVAGVTVIILGLSNINEKNIRLYIDNLERKVPVINAYLLPANKDLYIYSRTQPISGLPPMNQGNMPADGGQLLFNTKEKETLIKLEPKSEKWFKKLLTVKEHLNGRERWCLWLENITENEIKSMPEVQNIINNAREIRLK